ncbi:phosphoadenosine phosphosulfate reductase family protein [Streptomyces sp. NRRL S-350]|uniref:phosphoadenosine phosphosulfate reductase domain-containing protein n=1 Tax=Streptomyces sp. NRRL S-350 TaxID=1463902 RepID=UPI000691142E|nr:phosphoadenosine phosphosulfate reductase family protein [Streptomyces sp. NRRL S-350]
MARRVIPGQAAFDLVELRPEVPDLASYRWIIANVSGGKDSQAMLAELMLHATAAGVADRVVVVHADLGIVEWPGVRELAEEHARHYGLRFETVQRVGSNLIERVEERGMWPSADNRWCTSDFKRGPIRKLITMLVNEARAAGHVGVVRILNVMGLRADESAARRKLVPFCHDGSKTCPCAECQRRRKATEAAKEAAKAAEAAGLKPKKIPAKDRMQHGASNTLRWVDTWLPIHGWSTADVWAAIFVAGTRPHPAYKAGMPRLSCVFCLAGETEVVTRAGLRPIAELAGGRHELLIPKVTPYGLSGAGSFKEVEVRAFGVQRLWRITMHRGRQTRIVHATAEHRWLTWDRKLRPPKKDGRHNGYEDVTVELVTSELTLGTRLRSVKAQSLAQGGEVPFAVAQGFVYGDGTKGSGDRPACLDIHLAEKDGAILPYFAAHRPKPTRLNGKDALRIYGLPRLWKEGPDLRESRSFLLSWLAGYFAADGTVTEHGSARMASASKESMQVIRDVAAVCGVGYGPVRTSMRVGTGKAATPLYTITLDATDLPDWFWKIDAHRDRIAEKATVREAHDRLWVVDEVTPTDRVEEVYCAVVPGAQAFALAEDLMTGNCVLASRAALVRAAHLQPALAARYALAEEMTGHRFRLDVSMAEIIAEAATAPAPAAGMVVACWEG